MGTGFALPMDYDTFIIYKVVQYRGETDNFHTQYYDVHAPLTEDPACLSCGSTVSRGVFCRNWKTFALGFQEKHFSRLQFV
jgi:hypothetical protein